MTKNARSRRAATYTPSPESAFYPCDKVNKISGWIWPKAQVHLIPGRVDVHLETEQLSGVARRINGVVKHAAVIPGSNAVMLPAVLHSDHYLTLFANFARANPPPDSDAGASECSERSELSVDEHWDGLLGQRVALPGRGIHVDIAI